MLVIVIELKHYLDIEAEWQVMETILREVTAQLCVHYVEYTLIVKLTVLKNDKRFKRK